MASIKPIPIFVVTIPNASSEQSTTLVNTAVSAHWTHAEAERQVKAYRQQGISVSIQEVNLDPLSIPVDGYFERRGLKDPDAQEAFLFLVSEVGEMSDALVSYLAEGWVRNNPQAKHAQPQREGGDVLMMLVKTMEKLGFDPIAEMLAKWRDKGIIV